MKTSDNIEAITKAFIKAQSELPNPPKDSTNPHFKNRYASLAGIRDVCQPILTKNGLAVVHFGGKCADGDVEIGTRLIHDSGQWFETVICMRPDRPGAQAVGSCITYGRRYGLCALLGIVADEDDDGNEAAKPAESKSSKTAGKPEPKASKDQVLAISVALDESGSDYDKFLAYFKVKAVEDLTASQANKALSMLKNKSKKAAA